jgi:hypothetical protein
MRRRSAAKFTQVRPLIEECLNPRHVTNPANLGVAVGATVQNPLLLGPQWVDEEWRVGGDDELGAFRCLLALLRAGLGVATSRIRRQVRKVPAGDEAAQRDDPRVLRQRAQGVDCQDVRAGEGLLDTGVAGFWARSRDELMLEEIQMPLLYVAAVCCDAGFVDVAGCEGWAVVAFDLEDRFSAGR